MALHFILDGYNIIKQTPGLALKKLEQGRDGLEQLIKKERLCGSSRNRVTIVFDSQQGGDSYQRGSFIKVIFARGESADEKIKSLVDEAQHKKTTIVVTDDRALKYYVRALGAKVLGVRKFLSQGRKQETKVSKTLKKYASGRDVKNISKSLEFKINAELEDIWLHKKG